MDISLTPDYRLLFEFSPHPYLVLRPDTGLTIVAVNNSYLEATNTRRSDIIGCGLFEVFPDNPTDPTASGVSDLHNSLDRVIRDRVQDTMGIQKYDIPCAEGFTVKYWSPVNTPVFAADGEIAFLIHHVEDVTEFILKQQRASQESAQQIGNVEEHAARMEAEVMRRALEVKETNRQLKVTLEELEHKKAELTRLNNRLMELDKAKTAFFSNVSHELRTPLTLILGPLADELAEQRESLPPVRQERIEVAHRNSLRLLKLVNTLLDFTRIEAGFVKVNYEPVDLAALTTDLAGNFRSACELAGLQLKVDCPPLAELVCVDCDMWEKIVLNLMSNAFKFTMAGVIEVTLKQRGEVVELVVRDSGTGIPAQELSHIFERFHRSNAAKGRSHEGSGIGLALVRELATLHAGSVRAESAPGQGSTFTVTIPRGCAHLPPEQIGKPRSSVFTALSAGPYMEEVLNWLPADATAAFTENRDRLRPEDIISATAEGSPLGAADRSQTETKPRILWADDNADMRHYVQRLLSDRYEVEVVSDGQQALEAARRQPPDLVLSDVMMPQLDGFGLLKELRASENTCTIPVVLLSARAGEEARLEGLAAGADNYLVKPFTARELLVVVGAQVEMARLRQETNRLLLMQGRQAAIGEMVSSIAHQWRQPLNTIGMLIQGLLIYHDTGGFTREVLEESTERAMVCIHHMSQTIDDFRNFFKPDKERVEFGVLSAIQKALVLVEPRSSSLGIDIVLKHTADLKIFGYPNEYVQVLVVLLGNALDALSEMQIKDGSINIRAFAENGKVVLTVDDNAGGVPEGLIDKIFDPYVSTKGVQGTGIGLYMAKSIIEKNMGGRLSVRNNSDGAQFRIEV